MARLKTTHKWETAGAAVRTLDQAIVVAVVCLACGETRSGQARTEANYERIDLEGDCPNAPGMGASFR